MDVGRVRTIPPILLIDGCCSSRCRCRRVAATSPASARTNQSPAFRDRIDIVSVVIVSVADPDPFHFGQPDPGTGSKKSAKIMENVHKKTTKIIRISYIFFKTIKLMFTDINIYSINNKKDHISEKYIFYRYFSDFRSDLEQDPDPLFHETDPDPYQNEKDPLHWMLSTNVTLLIYRGFIEGLKLFCIARFKLC